ncbi:peptide/nickel transport system permease protein [Pacificibacter maritimus]|uniref:Peptide/nickel transport system permease protein n=1 Tax=Pacificibacter maritimus TaxID=762213 RepID=A0A3N4UUJ5_9RHOB|nr:ABC transporter permease [Pacificibacter maritimus]RPE71251.1 peptide/nickel transport system permease protein [Pacificibacter maritimus]
MTDQTPHLTHSEARSAKPRFGFAQLTGFALLAVLAIGALGGPSLIGQDPAKQSLLSTFESPSRSHLLGTDNLGRDMAARLLSGAQLSLSLALLSVITAGLPGTLLGVIAAWRGGWTDRLIGAFSDAVLALPGLLLVLMLAAISPGSWWALYAGISLTLWVEYFRYTRQRARVVLSEPAVEASRLLGLSPWVLLRRHLIPEIGPGLLTLAAFGAATAVTSVAALGFVSVGLRPPTAEWGVMMTELLPYWREAPFLILQPVLCLIVTVLALHLSVGGARRP